MAKRLTDKQIAALRDREAVARARVDFEAMRADLQAYGRALAARDAELAAAAPAGGQAIGLERGAASVVGALGG